MTQTNYLQWTIKVCSVRAQYGTNREAERECNNDICVGFVFQPGLVLKFEQ